jgi:hypothetical protein
MKAEMDEMKKFEREKKKRKKRKNFVLFVLSIVFFLLIMLVISFVHAQIYLGVAEGFVFYPNGSVAENALVTISVKDCKAEQQYCTRQAYSQSNGYYVIANLALEPYSYVHGSAQKGNFFIEADGQADGYGVVELNMTMCEAPSAPLLNYVANFHPTNKTYNVTFSWTSGIDPEGFLTYDSFYLDGAWQNAASPVIKINLDFGTHVWGVKTCNANCCSATNFSSFTIQNSIPPAPSLLDQGNTNNNSVMLFWQNVSDADGDAVSYDFMIDSELRQNVTSPQAVDGLAYGFHEWKVRACDLWQCSAWASDSFYVQNFPCPKPNITVINNTFNYENNQIKFEWQSAKYDAEGDRCHDEFMLNGNIVDRNATSPKILNFSDIQAIEWGVRSCDDKGACSEWARSSFIYCYSPEALGQIEIVKRYKKYFEVCEVKEAMAIAGYKLIVLLPKKLYQGEDFDIELELTPLEDFENVVVLIENKHKEINFSQEMAVKSKIPKNSTASFLIKGKTDIRARGNYDFFIKVIANNTLIIDKKINISIEEIPKVMKLLQIQKPYPTKIVYALFITTACTIVLAAILLYKLIAVVKAIVRKKTKNRKAK